MKFYFPGVTLLRDRCTRSLLHRGVQPRSPLYNENYPGRPLTTSDIFTDLTLLNVLEAPLPRRMGRGTKGKGSELGNNKIRNLTRYRRLLEVRRRTSYFTFSKSRYYLHQSEDESLGIPVKGCRTTYMNI